MYRTHIRYNDHVHDARTHLHDARVRRERARYVRHVIHTIVTATKYLAGIVLTLSMFYVFAVILLLAFPVSL